MKAAIAYSLFGSEEIRNENCFNFNSYLRGLMINIRLNRLIYPEWTVLLETDKNVYDRYGNLLDKLCKLKHFEIRINESAPLTKAMLWRLKPLFELDQISNKVWDYVLCRDLDSPPTYREAQAVKYWMNKGKAAHAITDSVSHDVPMLGGMIGFIPKHFTMKMGLNEWGDMFENCDIEFGNKGADQLFLTKKVYPKFAKHGDDSITQHYCLGMPNSFLSDCHTSIQDMEIEIPFEYKESNQICGHIGSAGWYGTSTTKFIQKHKHLFEDLIEIEASYSDIFSWVINGVY